jgi:acetyl-CoA carboxylase beta subunit
MVFNCPSCWAFMHDHPTMRDWFKCPSCGWCHDLDGENEVTRSIRDEADLAKVIGDRAADAVAAVFRKRDRKC